MQCPQCQHENLAAQKFCGECGGRLQAICPACQTTNSPGQKFCGECGERLTAAAPSLKPGAPAPEAYTPKHLAERILTSRAALEGERKQVTVLFADLKGSMELLAERDPEDARRILDPVLERMMDAVHRYEGTVNQVMGDGIMALFGAPLAHEDHAVRACYAALRMQESVKQYADELRRTEGVLIQIRVGLNSGEVVVRSIGSDLRMDYTAVGQTTHLAARMEQLAAPGSILLAPPALQLAEGYVEVQALGPMAVKGLAEPVEVYELLGAGTARSRLQAAATRGLTKFVGRDAELETLRRTLEQAGAGHGQIVALVGEPGVGKSRLVWEFCHSHRTQGWLVLESGSVSYGKATSYLPVIDLLRSYFGIENRDGPRRIREKLTGKLLTLDPALQPSLSAFLALLDVPVDDPTWQALDPLQRRQQTLDACKRLILRESQEQPLLLILEDLHWIDTETQGLLDSLVDRLPTARILLLVNYRPEYVHAWHRKTYYQQLRLDPLPPDSAEELLLALLGDAAELRSLKRLLIERTEGNPFFVEESVRTLVETGVVIGESGAYRPASSFESTQVPATVQAVLAARIDRLPAEDKRLLQSAAVIGKDVPYLLLQAIAELSEGALHQALSRLQAAELLYETALFPDLEYTFKHALTHEVAYGSLLQERRQVLHARIMAAIERLHTERLVEQVERLAHHAVRGEAWAKAVGYLQQAGLKAQARSAHREVVADLGQALAALEHLPNNRDTREQALELRLSLATSLMPLRDYSRIFEHLSTAEALARNLEDRSRLGRAACYMTNCLWTMGDNSGAIESGQRALAIAEALDDRTLAVQARFYLSHPWFGRGDYRRAAALLQQNQEALTGELLTERFGLHHLPSVTSRGWLAVCLAEIGELAAAIISGEEGVRIAEAADHPFSLIVALGGLGRAHATKGDFEAAIPVLARGLRLGELWDIPLLSGWVAPTLGYAYARVGHVAQGLAVLAEGPWATPAGNLACNLAWLAEAYLLAGRADEALARAHNAFEYAQEHEERGRAAWILRLLGELAAHADPPEVEQAEGYYRQALALANDLGMRPLAAHCHLGLGTVYRKVDRDEQAQAELAAATGMYRAMEMTYWLARAEMALAETYRALDP